jgi:hypothetical protein
LETCCGCGYDLAGKSICLPWIFKDQRERTGRHRSRGVLREQRSYLGLNPFQEVRPLRRKENSSQDSRWRLQVRLRCRAWYPRRAPISLSRLGNFNPIPFRSHASEPLAGVAACFRTALAFHLGSTDPCATAVHMEPFSTSVFKRLN